MDRRGLKRLQREWDQRLEDSGFVDAEATLGNGERWLRLPSKLVLRDLSSAELEARRDYFLQCSQLCARTKFKNRFEEMVMDLFCDGFKKQEIVSKLKERGLTRNRKTIYAVIDKYLILFGLYGK